ncbi:hypothetical protein [Limnohabitans sp.]|uniref:hypothetical protein n=1 Tax=Limnohabitans sp. TaxID=1907725 RepID=UPI0033416594
MQLHKLFFKSNGVPRPWLKRILFDKYLQLKGLWRWVVLDSSGDTRKTFSDWYSLVLHNPDPAIASGWPAQRDVLLKSRPFGERKTITVVSPNATLYVARMLRWQLSRFKLQAELVTEMPQHFGDGLYIVICPQTYKRLPPREQRIVFQMEQSVSTRWFTQEYLNVLYNSLAVFDYSLKNIAFLDSRLPGQLRLHHVPVEPAPLGALFPAQLTPAVKPADRQGIIFYGDPKSARRQKFLKELKQYFEIDVVQGLYGEALWCKLMQAELVLNIHYYEDALLETTRISECLCLGLTVISEASIDQSVHSSYDSRVIFTPVGDTEAMVQAIARQLSTPHRHEPSSQNNFGSGADLKQALQSLKVL